MLKLSGALLLKELAESAVSSKGGASVGMMGHLNRISISSGVITSVLV